MKIVIIISLCVLCCFSCNNDNAYVNEKFADTLIINVNDIKDDVALSDLFSKVKFIPLETNQDCLIGSVDKILLFKDNYFILDKMSLSLFIFSKNGDFIHKISQVGKGPNEYTTLSNFFIDTEKNWIILDADLKLLFFDLHTYKLIKEVKTSLNAEMAYLGDETFAYYLRNGTWNGKNNIIVEKNGKIVYQSLPIPRKMAGFLFSREWSFSQPLQNNQVFFTEPFDYKVYLLNNDSMIVKYHIDFGKHALPSTYFDDIPRQERTERVLNAPYCSLISDYFRNDHLLLFNFTYKGSSIYYFNFFDRCEEFLFTGFNDDILYTGTPLPMLYIDSTNIISFFDVTKFKEGLESYNMIQNRMKEYEKEAEKAGQTEDWKKFQSQFRNNSENYYEQMKYLSSKNEEDNPVIVKWYFN